MIEASKEEEIPYSKTDEEMVKSLHKLWERRRTERDATHRS